MIKYLIRINSIIPTRSEKRSNHVKWKVAWQNFATLRGVSAEVRVFVWKMQQDLLNLGARMHRPNINKRCMMVVSRNDICEELETREHVFIHCEIVCETCEKINPT